MKSDREVVLGGETRSPQPAQTEPASATPAAATRRLQRRQRDERQQTIFVRPTTREENSSAYRSIPEDPDGSGKLLLRQFQRFHAALTDPQQNVQLGDGVVAKSILDLIKREPDILTKAIGVAPLVDPRGEPIVGEEPYRKNWATVPRSFANTWGTIKKYARNFHDGAKRAAEHQPAAMSPPLENRWESLTASYRESLRLENLEAVAAEEYRRANGLNDKSQPVIASKRTNLNLPVIDQSSESGQMKKVSPPSNRGNERERTPLGVVTALPYREATPKSAPSGVSGKSDNPVPPETTCMTPQTPVVPGAFTQPRSQVEASETSISVPQTTAECSPPATSSSIPSHKPVKQQRQDAREFFDWWRNRHLERYGSGSRLSGYKPLDPSSK